MEVLGSRHLRNRKIVNLSGQTVKVGRKTYEPGKAVTSAAKTETGTPSRLPARVPGKLIIVSEEMAKRHPERDDLIFVAKKNGRDRFHTAWRHFNLRRRLPTDRELRYLFWADLLKRSGKSRHLVDSIGLNRLEKLRTNSKNELKTVRGMAALMLMGENLPSEFRKVAQDIDPAAAFATRLRELRREARSRQQDFHVRDENTDAHISVTEKVTENGERVAEAVGHDTKTGEAYRSSGSEFNSAKENVLNKIQFTDDMKSGRKEHMESALNSMDSMNHGKRGEIFKPPRDRTAEMARQQTMTMER